MHCKLLQNYIWTNLTVLHIVLKNESLPSHRGQDGRFCRGQQLRCLRSLPELVLLLHCRHRRRQACGRRKIQHRLAEPKNNTISDNFSIEFFFQDEFLGFSPFDRPRLRPRRRENPSENFLTSAKKKKVTKLKMSREC